MAVHYAVGISRQRNNGYRPSRVNIMAQGLFTLDPSLSPTHLSIRRGRATTTHYTHHHVSLMVSRNITLERSRAMLCISAAYAVIRCLSVCVCASVTFVYHVKMNKRIFEIFSPSGSHTTLLFPHQTGWRYSDWKPPPPNGRVECRWGRQKLRF